MWTRTILLLLVALWGGRCAESPGLMGPTDAEATEQGDIGAVPLFDSGAGVDTSAQSDVALDSTTENAALDGSGDGVDTTDVSPDAAGEMGTRPA